MDTNNCQNCGWFRNGGLCERTHTKTNANEYCNDHFIKQCDSCFEFSNRYTDDFGKKRGTCLLKKVDEFANDSCINWKPFPF